MYNLPWLRKVVLTKADETANADVLPSEVSVKPCLCLVPVFRFLSLPHPLSMGTFADEHAEVKRTQETGPTPVQLSHCPEASRRGCLMIRLKKLKTEERV